MVYESLILLLPNCRFMVQLHPLAHAQFVGKAHRSETKFEKGASDRNSRTVYPEDISCGGTQYPRILCTGIQKTRDAKYPMTPGLTWNPCATQPTPPAGPTSTTTVLYVHSVPPHRERACLDLFWAYESVQ